MFSRENFDKQIVYGILNKSVCCLCKPFASHFYLLFAILATLLKPGEQHYEPGLDVCILANICNHTYNQECGKERKDLDKRTFIDECDMFEYNCDYRKDYFIVPYEECNYTKETKMDVSTKELLTVSTDQHSDMDTKNKSSKISTLVYLTTKNNEISIDTTVPLTKIPNSTTSTKMTEHKHSHAGACTCGAKSTQILTNPSRQPSSTTTTKLPTTTEYISPTRAATTTDTTTHITTPSLHDITTKIDKSSQLPQLNTVTRNCTRKTTTSASSKSRKPHTTFMTTISSAITTEKDFSSTPLIETTILTVTNHTSKTTEKNNASECKASTATPTPKDIIPTTHVISKTTKPTTDLTSKDTMATTHVTSESTLTTKMTPKSTKPTTKLTSTNVKKNSPCAYPKDCKRPLTWETTAKGETRDFYQILRARYGDRLKTMKGTTHWPRRRGHLKGNYNFFASHHNEG